MEKRAVVYWPQGAAMRVIWLVIGASLTGALSLPAASAAETKLKSTVPLEKLVTLNAVALFGTEKVTLTEDVVKIVIDKDGHMAGAFKGKNIFDSVHPEMVGANRGFFTNGEKPIPGFCVLGKGRAVWTSRFQLAGKTNVQFNFRIPNLLGRASDIRLRINSKKRGGFETAFFNSIATVKGGKPRGRVATKLKKFRGVPTRWFPRSAEAGVKVEFGIDEKGVFSRLDNEEIVRLKTRKTFKDSGGAVVFSFNKLLFTLQNLQVSGLLDREWAAKALVKLEKRGKLVEKDPTPKEAPAAPEPESKKDVVKLDPDDDVEL